MNRLVVCGLMVCCVIADGCEETRVRSVSPSQVAGTWYVTPSSIQMITKDGVKFPLNQKLSITFNLDGSATFASAVEDIAFGGHRYLSSTATWTIKHDAVFENSENRQDLISLTFPNGQLHRLAVKERGDHMVLWMYYSDPDNAEYIEYEKGTFVLAK